jgi:hypothetical protein
VVKEIDNMKQNKAKIERNIGEKGDEKCRKMKGRN